MRKSSILFNVSLAMALVVLSASAGLAQTVASENFSDVSVTWFSSFRGGELVETKFGAAWKVAEPHQGYVNTDSVLYELSPADIQLLTSSGTLEVEMVNYLGRENLEGVIEFLDDTRKSLVSFMVRFKSDGQSTLVLDGLEKPFKYWGSRGYFPSVPSGSKVQMVITWGSAPETENAIYMNGLKLKLNRIMVEGEEDVNLATPAQNLAELLERATHLRIGGLSYRPSDDFSAGHPAYSTAILSFRLDDEIRDVSPRIASVTHNAFSVAGYSGRLVPGDVLEVNLVADPGGIATFDLGTGIKAILMFEDDLNPGTYKGIYTVKPGDFVENEQVVAHFTNSFGIAAQSAAVDRSIEIDGTSHIAVNASNDLVPADESARSGLTVIASDANGKAVQGHELKLTLSTTDDYTGIVGSGSFEDLVGGTIDVDWGGITDSFGEVTAQYVSGFAAKTILVSAKDMVSGDVGVGFVRSFIDGTVDIVVTEPKVTALSVSGTMDVSLSRDWLTADGQSRSRITAVVKDADGEGLSGHTVQFTLLGKNGSIRVVQGKTDSRGRAFADYIAGTVMGQVQVEVRDMTSGMTAIVGIELRPDAPAVIELAADPAEVVTGGETTVTAKVTDANDNPNRNVDVICNISIGEGALASNSVATDEDGVASVTFTAGDTPGLVTIRGTVISREPTVDEVSAAKGAVFLYGLEEDPGRLDVLEWLVQPGDEVVEGQALVFLEDRSDTIYTVVAPGDGTVATFVAEERDRTEYGDTLGYILEVVE